MAQIKRVMVGGCEFRLAPLTLEQVELLLDPEAQEDPWQAIRTSVTNAVGEEDWRTRDLLTTFEKSLDLEGFRELNRAVLDLSGLKHQRHVEAEADGNPSKGTDFEWMRARLSAQLGWTEEQCGRTSFPRVLRIFEYWRDTPPVNETFAAFVDYRRPQGFEDYDPANDSNQADKVRLVVDPAKGGGQLSSLDNLPEFMQEFLARDFQTLPEGGKKREVN